MPGLDVQLIDQCIDRSLELLRRTYRTGPGNSGGWYHNLDSGTPGPSATCVGMSSFLLTGSQFDHLEECLNFLRARQIRSRNLALDGGWAVNTSFGQPITEATALIARLLVTTRVLFVPGSPDVARATLWLSRNQNADGGWGSFGGQESRVWLTAMAVQALSDLDPHGNAIRLGTHWLARSRDPITRAWGERPGQGATVAHTAYVLAALVDSGVRATEPSVAEAVASGYEWLTAHLDPTSVVDDQARVESYNLTRVGPDGRTKTWHSTVWHHGLPYAVSALVRQPEGLRFDLLCKAVNTIIASQQPDGRWPSLESAAAVSVWTVWPFLEALTDVTRAVRVANRGMLTWISSSTLVVQRDADRAVPLIRLMWRGYRWGWARWIGRRWGVVTLAASIATGLALVLTGSISWATFLSVLMIPVLLLVIQVAISRSR